MPLANSLTINKGDDRIALTAQKMGRLANQGVP